MAQWVKALVAKPEDLSSFPRSHIIEKENRLYKLRQEMLRRVTFPSGGGEGQYASQKRGGEERRTQV